MMTADQFYQQQIMLLQQQTKNLLRKKSYLGWSRFGIMVLIAVAVYFLWPFSWTVVAPVVIVLFFIFIQIIYRDLRNNEALAHARQLMSINESEVTALHHNYYHFNNGTSHIPKDHFYANDIDIFGHASLFQYLNRTVSEMGSARLASWLLNPAGIDEIMARQEAVKELSLKKLWGQQLQAYGKKNPIRIKTMERLQFWLYEPDLFSHFKHWQWLRYLLPLISISISIAAIFSLVPMSIFYATMLLMAAVGFPQEKKVGVLHNQLSKMVAELDTLSESIRLIEEEQFTSPLLLHLQQQFKQNHVHTSTRIRDLKKILDRLDLRFNLVLLLPMNLLLLWNLQQCLALEKWKRENHTNVIKWFDALGIFEALESFAVTYFNNPSWTFPLLKENHFFMDAKEMGHPLIPAAKRINNFLQIKDKASIMLVTGSNMAGKSTYLRSTGINVVLAMAGSPVCAASFILSPVQLISSMRIADNLEESTSTFYAELKKLKAIIDKVNKKEKVFILLDEILRGTNSLDRHTGSKALIKQLIKQEAAAIIATHDVDLADMQQTYPQNMFNFHFDVQVNNEELYFDYTLKPGVCTSLNASILMKKIGIEIDENGIA
jgi:MutS domain V/MutS domain III